MPITHPRVAITWFNTVRRKPAIHKINTYELKYLRQHENARSRYLADNDKTRVKPVTLFLYMCQRLDPRLAMVRFDRWVCRVYLFDFCTYYCAVLKCMISCVMTSHMLIRPNLGADLIWPVLIPSRVSRRWHRKRRFRFGPSFSDYGVLGTLITSS